MRRRALSLLLLLGGCAGQPFEYRAHTDIPEGPGLLSGAAGAVSLRAAEPVAPQSEAEWQEFREWREWQRRQKEAKN